MRGRSGCVSRWAALAVAAGLTVTAPVLAATANEAVRIEGLPAPVSLGRDANGVVHITAPDEESMAFAQGYAHARDRLFQMDLLRRTASGTLAELVGSSVLQDDVELRTIGLRRAAERTLPLLSEEVRTALDAYARGVNAYKNANLLPPEYTVLELTTISDWTPEDSVVVGKLVAFQLSADFDDIDRTGALLTYRAVLNDDEHQGRGDALFFEDLWRVAPFEPIATIPPKKGEGEAAAPALTAKSLSRDGRAVLELIRATKARLEKAPILQRLLHARERGAGSNAFVVSGRLTKDRRPLLANDPHLDLPVPSIFYPIQLRAVHDGFDVRGVSFAGLPYVVQGVNPFLAWGVTTSGVDVTDIYQEQLVPDPNAPIGLSTVYQGGFEPVQAVPQAYRFNVVGDGILDNLAPAPSDQVPPATLIVPRRNDGPIINADLSTGEALSLQWAGFSPTFEIEAFRGLCLARNRSEFEKALKRFDVGSQNFVYAGRDGTIAYYLSGEIPLREDLEAGSPIVPPFLIRNGQGGQEWVPATPAKDQALPYAILPANEMPREINPPAGYLVSANNDPNGDTFDNDALNQRRKGHAIRYLGADFNPGLRAKRIDDLLRAGGKTLSFDAVQAIQADVVIPDAAVFVAPHILRAFDAVKADPSSHPALQALVEDPEVAEAVERLRTWQFTAPTGVPEGFDAADKKGALGPVSETEIRESIATTIFSLWRAEMIANTIDETLDDLPKPRSRYAIRALRHLLDTFDTMQGKGASGLDFFAVPDVDDPFTRRDIIILQSLRDALDRLASPTFAAAFAASTDQDDYRWGRLHRLEVNHPLGGPFSFTSEDAVDPRYRPPFAGLPGIPVDGGFETVDRSTHDVRAGLPISDPEKDKEAVNDFVFEYGSAQRLVASLDGFWNRAENALPGGASGVLGSPFYANLFGPWLTNDAFRFGPCSGGCGSFEILVPEHYSSAAQTAGSARGGSGGQHQ